MLGVIINLNIAAPYLSLIENAKVTGILFDPCRDMVKDGRIIIRPKELAGNKVEVT